VHDLRPDLGVKSLREPSRIASVGAGEDHGELIAPDARHDLELADRARQHARGESYRVVSGVVSVLVIHDFQVIEID